MGAVIFGDTEKTETRIQIELPARAEYAIVGEWRPISLNFARLSQSRLGGI